MAVAVDAGRVQDPFRVPVHERLEPLLASFDRWRDRPLASAGAGVVVAAMIAVGWWLGRPSSAGLIEDAIPFTAAADPAGLSSPPSPGVSGPSSVAPDPTARASASPGGSVESGDPLLLLVHVAGAVVRPGVVELTPGDRVIDAVMRAGGPTPAADLHQLNLAAPVLDGLQITVPARGETAPSPTGVAPGPGPGGAGSGAAGGPLDVNLASEAELDELPGIGPSLAAAIAAWREERGPFTSIDALLDVPGIGPAKLAALLDHVTV